MTTVRTFQPHIRRHDAGSIDFDHYRTRATALRGQMKREVRSLKLTAVGLLVIAFTFVVVLIVVAGRTSTPDGEKAVIRLERRASNKRKI